MDADAEADSEPVIMNVDEHACLAAVYLGLRGPGWAPLLVVLRVRAVARQQPAVQAAVKAEARRQQALGAAYVGSPPAGLGVGCSPLPTRRRRLRHVRTPKAGTICGG